MADIFGRALMDYFQGKASTEIIRRDDGWTDENRDLQIYFSTYTDWLYAEKEVIKYAQGRVLDIGGGAGRHSLYLQGQGFEVHAIDISSLAVEVMQKRGVKNVYLRDLWKLGFPNNYFDTILMMFNNFGLAGTIGRTKKLLKILYRVSTPQARIIATILDPYKTNNLAHLAYHKKNRQAGKPSGQVKIRIEYKNEIGDWFYLLMVSVKELEQILKGSGWSIFNKVESLEHLYGVVLKKD